MSREVALIQIPVGTGDRLYYGRRDLPYGIAELADHLQLPSSRPDTESCYRKLFDAVYTLTLKGKKVIGCPITDLEQPVQGPMKCRCDMGTLERLIGWRPRYSIEEGVRRTYELMKSWRKP